ncbi:MAG: hypothetical protein HC774_07315 [Sphingomonadales bacterium]|nr:hypothetical protein [Sphingomonadales bacterium]
MANGELRLGEVARFADLVRRDLVACGSDVLVAESPPTEEQAKQATPATEIESPKELTATAQSSGEDYVVVMTDKDTTPLSVYQKYLESADLWRQLTEHNLLKDGTTVRIPKGMLKDGQIPAKVSKFNGNVEIARNFDWKWVSVVDNMLSSRKATGFAPAPSPRLRSCRMTER